MITYTTIESSILTFGRLLNIIKKSEETNQEAAYLNFTNKVFEKLNTASKTTNLGVLWNALTEKTTGHLLETRCPELDIHIDSGGLQQITLGLECDKDFRSLIYEKQALLGTHAMSFDVMPIRVKESDEKKNRLTDHSEKYMILDLLYKSGVESAYNVIEQYRTFKKIQSKNAKKVAGIMVIFQGSAYENYQDYAKGMFDTFKSELDSETLEDLYAHIRGVALGLSGITNYFDLFDTIIRLPIEADFIPERIRSEIHFLGLGGITKVAPLYALNKDFFGRDIVFTFDSTSRTNSATYGRITENFISDSTIKRVQKSLGRHYGENVEKHLLAKIDEWGDIITSTIGEGVSYDRSNLTKFRNRFSPFREDKLRLSGELLKEFGKEKSDKISLDITGVHDFLLWASELLRFFEILDVMTQGRFGVISKKELRSACELLSTLKNYDDYMKIREIFHRSLKTVTLNNINVVQTYEEFENPSTFEIEEW